MYRQSVSALAALLLAGCATRAPAPVAVADVPPPAPVAVAMPHGAYPGMAIPARLADGRYATPNRNLSAAGALWHFRAALNVAALACRGTDETAIIAGYNALLAREKAPLATAQASYVAEYKASGGDWQDRYDDQMTRLYNFFSQSPARDEFCAAAAATRTDSASVAPADLPAFAAGRLAVLERPFTAFFAAYDAWRADRAAAAQVAVAMPPPAIAVAAPAPIAPPPPRLTLDPSVFRDATLAMR